MVAAVVVGVVGDTVRRIWVGVLIVDALDSESLGARRCGFRSLSERLVKSRQWQ